MARRRGIEVEGLNALLSDLRRLEGALADEKARRVMLRAAQLVERQAEANAPTAPRATYRRGRAIPPGGLQRAIKSAPGRGWNWLPNAYAAVDIKMAPHKHLVEGGTKPHLLKPREKKALFTRTGGHRPVRGLRHPGARRNPFWTRAVRATRGRVIDHVVTGCRQLVQDAASRGGVR